MLSLPSVSYLINRFRPMVSLQYYELAFMEPLNLLSLSLKAAYGVFQFSSCISKREKG